ncbi:ABC transporter ATP-binding protein [Saccharothrix sp. NRRL B-16314]|uniref:ABC transporter ATP-binding protein n=1 Tax=Saccharothrix sp. NRRL B-16314 TaxID=1463825 RepID=UPI000689360F|nr:ABC transporter ATP-binding protein [Saccharothrix sp. NRRL B-16314]
MTAAADPVIETRDLRVELGGNRIIDGVDLAVHAGEWVTIIGPNGAGKSTLLGAVTGLVPATGEAYLLGREARRIRHRERARLVASVAQSPVVPPGVTVLDYVLLGRTAYIPRFGRESAADLDVVHEVLVGLELYGFAGRVLTTLSGGELQRVFLARALAQQARLLLLDEPTSALDIGHQQEVLDLVDALRRDHELTVLTTMHDLSITGAYADRVVLLAGGRVVADGTPREVITEAALATHYQARVRVIDTGDGPLVVPVRAR